MALGGIGSDEDKLITRISNFCSEFSYGQNVAFSIPVMPSKVKANPIAEGNAGFLRPTFSSLRKAVDKSEGKLTGDTGKRQNGLKAQYLLKKIVTKTPNVEPNVENLLQGLEPVVLPSVQESPLHSSSSGSKQQSSPRTSLRTPLAAKFEGEENATNAQSVAKCPKVTSTSDMPVSIKCDANTENEIKIQDARRVCDELRQQIEDLKLQQKAFQSRLSGEFSSVNKTKDNFEQVKVTGVEEQIGNSPECESCEVVRDKDLKKVEECDDAAVNLLTPMRKLVNNSSDVQKACDECSSVTEDSFNLHGSVTSSDVSEFVVKEEMLGPRGLSTDLPPHKVIKRLLSERERYKKKVKHLQMALHRLKKRKRNHVSRTPDIAAHDIVYFNADLIGEGYLSYVYSGTIYKNQKAAIKKLVRPDMMSSSDRSYLAAEAGLLMALHHRNIVEVFGVSTAPLQPLIVTELIQGKNLQDRLHSSDGWPLSPVEYYSTARDITVGMAYLHGQKPPVLHLNLRPCNVLIHSTGRAKVSDFGFSKIRLDAGISNRMSLAYLAPELLRFPVHLTTKLDVFSYAVILWEMSTMSSPYENLKASEILDTVSSGRRLNIPCELPSGFHAIISRAWDHSPMQRPSFKELIILLETLTLPQEWEDSIKRSQLDKTDTKGLITPRDEPSPNGKPNGTGFLPSTPAKSSQHVRVNSDDATKLDMKKFSEELALESDMITHGYILPKHERQESENYLRGFKMSPVIPQSQHRNLAQWKPPQLGHHKSLMSCISPYKYHFVSPPPPMVLPYYHGAPSHEDRFDSKASVKAENNLPYKAARNLIPELAAHAENHKSERENSQRRSHSGGNRWNCRSTDQRSACGNAGMQKRGSQSSSETDTSLDGTNADTPMPLSNQHFHFHSQDLAVETPKIVTGRSSKHPGRSKMVEFPQHSPRSPEDLRMAVSIPYLKNLRSGDEISSASGDQTNRSDFDEKLSSYVSQACRAESRNYVDAKMKGWRSDRSAILNTDPTAPPSDLIKVRSITSTMADHGFGDGSRKVASSAISESPITVMTAQFKPDKETRKQLNYPADSSQYDGILSPTLSDKSADGMRRIAVASVPSTSGTKISSQMPQQSIVGPRIRHSSEGKAMDTNPGVTNQQRFLRRESSWNKLKNSYSPEPHIPNFAPLFGTPPRSSNIPLPPVLAAPEMKDSAFTRLPPSLSKHTKTTKTRKRHQASMRNDSYKDLVPTNGHHINEVDRASNSTVSSAANDDIGEALADTAKELTEVSGILGTAAKQHQRSSQEKRQGKKP